MASARPGSAVRGRRDAGGSEGCLVAGIAEGASPEEAIVRAHEALARAPSAIVTATLDDALAVRERPNVPGTISAQRANWSLALPVPVEEFADAPLVRKLAGVLGRRGPM